MRWIHDVTTDPENPPQFLMLRPLREQCSNGAAYSGLNATAHQRRYPDIQPLIVEQTPEAVFYAACDRVNALKWALVTARKWRKDKNAEIEGLIEATATTRLLRFKDDVVIRIVPNGDSSPSTRVDMRSASRVGKTDLGANARRVTHFLNILKNTLKSNTYKK